MTHRSNTRAKSIWARAAALLAAYAFVLQTVLAPIAAAATPRAVPADSAALVLCAEHAEALDQTQPIAPHDHEVLCKFCIGCPASALLATDSSSHAAVISFAITPIHWHAVSHFVSDRDFFAGKQARGPPALT